MTAERIIANLGDDYTVDLEYRLNPDRPDRKIDLKLVRVPKK